MSNVWRAQRRLLLELLEAFARRLSGEEKIPSEVMEEQALRLLWVPDVVAWCHGAGGDWHRRVSPLVEAVIDLGCLP